MALTTILHQSLPLWKMANTVKMKVRIIELKQLVVTAAAMESVAGLGP